MSFESDTLDMSRREWDSLSSTPSRSTLVTAMKNLSWNDSVDGKLISKIRKVGPTYQVGAQDFVQAVFGLPSKTLLLLKKMEPVEAFLRLYCFWKHSNEMLPFPPNHLTLSPRPSAKNDLPVNLTETDETCVKDQGDDETTSDTNAAILKWASSFKLECQAQLDILNKDGLVDPPQRTMQPYMTVLIQKWNQLSNPIQVRRRWSKFWK